MARPVNAAAPSSESLQQKMDLNRIFVPDTNKPPKQGPPENPENDTFIHPKSAIVAHITNVRDAALDNP